MNITKIIPYINKYKFSSPAQHQETLKQCPNLPSTTTTAAICTCSFGKAQVEMQNDLTSELPEWSELEETVSKIIVPPNQKADYFRAFKGVQRCQIKQLIEKWNIYDTCAHAAKFPDSSDVYILNEAPKAIKIYDKDGELKKEYTAEEYRALKEYKYTPQAIHEILRQGKNPTEGYVVDDDAIFAINGLERLFSNDKKVYINEEPKTLYRALQTQLSAEDQLNLKTIGATYIDPSFPSTTTDIGVARRFSHGNHILEIEFPKGAKYLDLDKLFNIDYEHWTEDEFLLNKDSKFIVTGIDKENKIIKVRYCCE